LFRTGDSHGFLVRCVVATVVAGTIFGPFGAHAQSVAKYKPPVAELEDYKKVPMPPGIGVQHTDVDGPVFVDTRGHTLYTWPALLVKNGDAGEYKGKPLCDNTKLRKSAGLMSPYPSGFILPDVDTRPSCLEQWPLLAAPEGAKPVGDWSIIARADGQKQWAYQGFAVYTSALDTRPGTVNGANNRRFKSDSASGTRRIPIGPPPNIPAGFNVLTVATGRLLTNPTGFSVYMWDGDGPNQSNCTGECLKKWAPIGAPEVARPQGEWNVIENVPGVKQWTYRKRPLYMRIADTRVASLKGTDEKGWRNVYTQEWADPPQEFTVQDSRVGQVLADKNGMTLYVYTCLEDTIDHLVCDHPSTTQAYRLAICGNSDPVLCNKTFPYVQAPVGVKVKNLIWATTWIDPQTGKIAQPKAPGALHVWTYRDRPIYTFGRDKKPGDADGDAWGEVYGYRNGFKAFWLRDDFMQNTL